MTEYAGFTLVYDRRNSLVGRIKRTGSYERETVEAITGALLASDSRILLDVGANIGLISLAVLEAVPDSVVYAFEPGLRQRSFLAQTVRRNDLERRLHISSLALSDTAGPAQFAVHPSRHAAGDGFLDTGRARKARLVTVETETLDAWWEHVGRPKVAVVKLDTEGSELLVLRGATAMLEVCRPVLFLEIQDENLHVYPFGPDEVHRAVEGLGYSLQPLERGEFVARPT